MRSVRAADDRQHEQGHRAARAQDQPGQKGGVAHEVLQKQREQNHRTEKGEKAQKHHRVAHGKGAVLEDPQVDDGVLVAQLPPDQEDQAHRRDHGQGQDEGGLEPVVLLALVQNDLEAADAHAEQGQAQVVHLLGLVPPDLVGRIKDVGRDHAQGDQPDGQVDVEDPAPGGGVGQPAAQKRAQDRPHHHPHAVDAHGQAPFLGRKGLQQDGLGHGLKAPAADALEDPEEDEPGQGGGRPAQQRGQGEHGQGAQEVALAAEDAGQPAAHGDNHRVGHQIGGQDPGHLLLAGREAALDMLQGHVGHGGVQDLDQGRDHDRSRDQPLVGR